MGNQIDTSGHFHVMPGHPLHRFMGVNRLEWPDLNPFTQGFIEAALAELFDPTKRGWKWEPAYNGYTRPDYHPNGTGSEWSHYPSDIDADEAWVVDHDCDGPPRFSDLAPETLARFMEDCARISDPEEGFVLPPDGASFWHFRNTEWQGNGLSGRDLRNVFPPIRLYLADDGKVRIEGAA